MNVGKNLFTVSVTEQWNEFPRGVVEFQSLEIFKTHLNDFLYNLL